jgi:hypothetical protein
MDDGDYAYDCWKDKQLEAKHKADDKDDDKDDEDTTVPLPEPDYEDLVDLNWVPVNRAPFRDGVIEDRDCDYWNNLK